MEFYDIYDKYGNKTNKVVNHDYKLKDGEYRAIVHLVIFNSKNEMLIQRRGLDKIDFPNCFDITSGGGVNTNETTYVAAKRELREELGLECEFDDRPYLRVFYKNGIDDYYILNLDIDLNKVKINNQEVLDFKWSSKEEILEKMKDKKFVSYNEGFIEFLFSLSKNRGTYLK